MKIHEYQAKEVFARYGIPYTPGTGRDHSGRGRRDSR